MGWYGGKNQVDMEPSPVVPPSGRGSAVASVTLRRKRARVHRKREFNKIHAHKETTSGYPERVRSQLEPLPPSTGLLQIKKSPPSQSEEKR